MTSSRGFAAWLVLVFLWLGALPSANALPAFARKYGLRYSACHEAWPMLELFRSEVQRQRLPVDERQRCAIWQNPGYWPVTFRMTPSGIA